MRNLLMSFLMVMLVIPSIAAAQSTEPVGGVSTGEDEVFRAYDNPDVYFDAIAGILTFGTVYDDDTAASRSIDTTAAIFAASLRSGVSSDEMSGGDYEFGELEDAEIGQIGDESSASVIPFALFSSFEGEYGVVIVRQDAWVQVLIGFGIGEVDVVAELEALATAIQPRWPSDDEIAVREDGLRTGGVWNMTPMPEDLSDGFEIDEGFEEGPAATTDAIVALDPTAPDTDEEPTEPGPQGVRDLPLIPEEGVDEPSTAATPVPIDVIAEPVDPPSDEPELIEPIGLPTGTPQAEPEDVAVDPEMPGPAETPVMSDRLAQPFDVSFEIIIAAGHFVRNDDGSCSGSGLIETLGAEDEADVEGELALRERNGDALATAELDGAAMLGYDTVLEQDVCYMTAQFSDVPGRSRYILVAGESVIGRFGYDDLASGEPVLVVIGADGP
ncbi:MAG: hypothetical protein H0V98_00485 [Chloroflexia bacterium]|nr:hypothetical protein [Chloroflexia bacterium]